MAGIQRDIELALEQEKEQAARNAEMTMVQGSTGSSVRDVIKRRGPKKDADKNAA
jgi:hypothetical protein